MTTVIDSHAALIVVDVQPDFMPGGALACHEGDAIVPGIDALMRAGLFDHVVATQDWHPAGHVSFASTHAGSAPFDTIALYGQPQTLWPDHCVQGSAGAALPCTAAWTGRRSTPSSARAAAPAWIPTAAFAKTTDHTASVPAPGWPAG
jgi:nicotinamidase/pyrazinamidase